MHTARVLLLLAIFCHCFSTAATAEGRVIILGFDGVEPKLAEEMMLHGQLPNLAKLQSTGTYTRLGSSNPPQSPTAWSSFATSKHPGNHGIYDFLRRTPSNYRPGVGFGSVVRPKLAGDGSLAQPSTFKNIRRGDSFWQVANKQGSRCKILSVPFAFPAEDLEESCMLSGLGVPDLRGTTSTFFLMSVAVQKAESLSGGRRVPLRFTDDHARVDIDAMRHPQTRKFVTVPLSMRVDRDARTLSLELPGRELTLREGSWSEWIEWSVKVTDKYTAYAISRIHVLEAGDQVRLYMTCLQFDPRKQFMRFTTPESYGSELYERYGHFKTIGWIYDTHALRQDALTERLFLEDVENTMTWRETLTLDELDRGNFDLLISAWTGTDRVAHLFWRFLDPLHARHNDAGADEFASAVEDTYRRMDEIVGKVSAKLDEDDLLLVISDHGFHSFRTGFNVNTWLIRNGYLAVEGKSDAATANNPKAFLQGYDWSRTKAYSLGLGSIFLNLAGREGQGIVSKSESAALLSEIRAKLLEVTDPDTGDKIFDAVYTREEFHGVAAEDAPDLQLGYADGYQSTKDAAKGSAPAELFAVNNDKWSGEHAASDFASTPGVFFSNRAIAIDSPKIVDIGVTSLKYLGRDVPADFEGRDLF